MIIETAVPFEELEEIKRKSGAKVKLALLGNFERNGIVLNRVLVEGPPEEIEQFRERLKLARAGG
ncbi:MAG: TIGR04140 family protein [Thermococci archaeon]|nr:TIGR04140 family protein [Thermococci archaeon]